MSRMMILNLGSTSTKVAVYDGENKIWQEVVSHPREEISRFLKYLDQYDYRLNAVMAELEKHAERLDQFDIFVSRGGTFRPVPGGVWLINAAMVEDARSGRYGDHPCNVGLQIIYDLAEAQGREAVTVDPPMVSDMMEEATYTGLPEVRRLGSLQALNHRAIARRYAREHGRDYEDLNVIVVHMGGGITVAAHSGGKIIDTNDGLAGDGPFGPERAGTVPTGPLIEMCYSGRYSREEMLRKVNGHGGLVAYLGLTDGRLIQPMIDGGDKKVEAVVKAMAFQVAKEIGARATVLSGRGRVDAILFTAGLSHWDYFVQLIRERVEWIAPVHLYPGENEIESLALGANRYLAGEERIQHYMTL